MIAPQFGCDDQVKEYFWEVIAVLWQVPKARTVWTGAAIIVHVGGGNIGAPNGMEKHGVNGRKV